MIKAFTYLFCLFGFVNLVWAVEIELDEIGTEFGFISAVGHLDSKLDLLIINSSDFGKWKEKKDKIYFYNDKELKDKSEIYLDHRGIWKGVDHLCFCGRILTEKNKTIKKIIEKYESCASHEVVLYCETGFPLRHLSNRVEVYGNVLQYNEKTQDEIVKISYENKDYYLDAKLIQDKSFRVSKVKYVEQQQTEVEKVLKDKSFLGLRQRLKKCMKGKVEKCIEKDLVFSKETSWGRFESCSSKGFDGQLTSDGYDDFTKEEILQCLKNKKSEMYKLLEYCLYAKSYPQLRKTETNKIIASAPMGKYCLFEKIGSHWKLLRITHSEN